MNTTFGPLIDGNMTRFRLYAPEAGDVALEMDGAAPVAMVKGADGFFTAALDAIAPGTRYRFRVGEGEGAVAVPDPASRGQAEDADGWSLTPAPARPQVPGPSRPWHEAIIAELHVGTATPEGTFRALIDRLDHYRDAGFTVIELMPVADFAGRRNWGYDGVLLYAPDTAYGTPDDLRALIDAAHERGLGMMLDVVYNHFGPSGNYLPLYAKSFFRDDIDTPWGPAIDLENPVVRAFFSENAAYWIAEFGFDGLRFDAVHALATKGAETFLREIAAACRAVKPDAWLVLENHDNIAGWMTRDDRLYDAQWNDDWHHAFHVLASGERTGYYAPYADDAVAAAGRALSEGFVFQGEPYPGAGGHPRGTVSTELAPDAFVAFAQNHDHIGNRPLGDRLAASLPPERLAFLRFVLMLSPAIPLLFQGEEALLSQPFPFFCDFEGELAEAVRQGRRSEFADFFDAHGDSFPDPLSEATFISAKLKAEDLRTPQARAELDILRRLADERRKLVWPLAASGYRGSDLSRTGEALRVAWHFTSGTLVMVLNGGHSPVTLDPMTGIAGMPVGASTGGVLHEAEGKLTLGPFAAAVWSLAPA
ncbi:malto-oligosyltrehalose trehalohydrolase [Ancylobacter sp. IITR112]|uniref:malto-oligosyltrehalose trehalohydrolase n=1 Tax=Ancylobacter sp. IITR112 TaxID=3138073 RepID=UPI00352AF56B